MLYRDCWKCFHKTQTVAGYVRKKWEKQFSTCLASCNEIEVWVLFFITLKWFCFHQFVNIVTTMWFICSFMRQTILQFREERDTNDNKTLCQINFLKTQKLFHKTTITSFRRREIRYSFVPFLRVQLIFNFGKTNFT